MRERWSFVSLGSVCDIVGGGTPSKANKKYYGGKFPWATVRDMNSEFLDKTELTITEEGVKNSSTNIIPEGNVIIATRVGLGKVCMLSHNTAINQDLKGVIPRKNNVLPSYVFWWFKSISNDIIEAGTGLTVKGVKLPFIKHLSFPLILLEEQQQIVAILDKTFAAIDQAKANIERNIENAKELFQSKLNQIFSQTGDGWEEKTLGEVCSLYQGLAINAKTKHLLVEKSNLPLLRIKDLKNSTEEQYVSENGYPENSKVDLDDLIYTRTGSLGLVFRNRRGILHNNSFKIEPVKGLSKNFLFWWLQHENFRKKIVSLASKAAQPDITHKLFKQQLISYPSFGEQEKFYQDIESLHKELKEIELNYQRKLTNLEELRNSILQKAFTGELTNKEVVV
ncbi:restriction endonuclease subunit S [Aestuariibaculum sp. M13]|uniref:restriction endonuclease subunit S n=1 Tax=Aestuariibaculum sp. M13 TaxID=2967132 RepID=UPI002159CF66|nr:restriction endonuclease subunit S [Aestuariibaculum sp. M13]MCR8667079.1 restriction endonuclease subunit S [Aestuariibaculum sp. M13]